MEEHFNLEAERHDRFFLEELGLKEFYDQIEVQVNKKENASKILVLGCGSGLEIERIKFKSQVTAIDISEKMIAKLEEKPLHPEVALKTICGSFLDIDFGEEQFDIVLSCYAMHHFNEKQKINLYKKINKSLKAGGVFINGDSMSKNLAEEKDKLIRAEKIYLDKGLPFASLHIDVHFCYDHELQILELADFKKTILEKEWDKTKIYRALK